MSKYEITPELLQKVGLLYPNCDVYKSTLKKDFICVRSFIGKSKFYKDDKSSFEINITNLDYLHVSEAILEIRTSLTETRSI